MCLPVVPARGAGDNEKSKAKGLKSQTSIPLLLTELLISFIPVNW